jgi:hypothetical protein
MGRFFSTAGPIQKENHYNIEPLTRMNPDEIKMLYDQHTKETGQKFNNDVFPLVWELTEGQPHIPGSNPQAIDLQYPDDHFR